MKQFFETYPNTSEILSPLVRQISWTNKLLIMSRSKSVGECELYLRLCIQEIGKPKNANSANGSVPKYAKVMNYLEKNFGR